MICKNCNFENPDDAVKCSKCGTLLDEDTKPNSDDGRETVILEASTRLHIDPLSFSPGEKFGDRYQIIEEIGQGGMGRVFKAKDLELETIVALKMIKPQFSTDPDIVARFKRELLLAREILHEHVIRIHDLGEIKGIKYISMNYIQGNTLKEILQSTGKLTIEKTIDIIRQVCNALIIAHGKGIIHRDLKPQNIMIDKNGKAYVLDFGIARSLHLDGDTSEEDILLGTPDFMSPEQIKGEKADPTSDIYALGIILYEMVTGKLPFTGETHRELLAKHINEIPLPPSTYNSQLPLNMERIILKCLEKKKKNRYQAVAEILSDLESDKTVEIPPQRVKIKKESKYFKPFLKTALRILIPLIFLYAVVSVSSLVNDSIYKVKIEKLQVEYDTYYKSYFPLERDWLPAQWEVKPCNGWDIYRELFPEEGDKLHKIPVESLNKEIGDAARLLNYQSIDELKAIIAKHEKVFSFQRLEEALHCSQLDTHAFEEQSQKLDTAMMLHCADLVALQARVDFWEGNYEQGLTRLFHFMIFSMDLFTASTQLQEEQAALTGFTKMCRELVPLLLSREIASETLPPFKTECLAVFGNFKEGLLPDTYDAPPEEEKIDLPVLASIENLLKTALNKFEPHPVFYKEYLNLANNYNEIHAAMGMSKSDYHLFGKLRFWEQWFSMNRYFYKGGIGFYLELLDGMKIIRDMHDKSNYINDYFQRHGANEKIITVNAPRMLFMLNAARTSAKLAVIICDMNRYGRESREFGDLKGTDIFINDLSGDRFEITKPGGTGAAAIVLDKNARLDLEKINYGETHKKILESFTYF